MLERQRGRFDWQKRIEATLGSIEIDAWYVVLSDSGERARLAISGRG